MTKRELLMSIPAEQWDKIRILSGLSDQKGEIEQGKFVSREVFDSFIERMKTMNEQEIEKIEYELIDQQEEQTQKLWLSEDKDEEIQSQEETRPYEGVRNILLIGSTGNGKSTLGNVLVNKNGNFEEVFTESSGSISETKSINEATFEVPIDKEGTEKITYRVIDTIGLGDTNLTPQGVLIRLAEVANRVKAEGLNHVLFVAGGRFTKEEIEVYGLLKSVIFDSEVVKYTTIVRTKFPEFEDQKDCEEDRGKLRLENPEIANILLNSNIVYVDNPPMKGRQTQINLAKEIREASREAVLKYLVCKPENYRPRNIDTLNERVENYKTNEQLLKDKMKELEAERKVAEQEFRDQLKKMDEHQKEMMRKNDEQVQRLQDQNLSLEKLAQEAKAQAEKARQEAKEQQQKMEQKLEKMEQQAEKKAQELKQEAERQRLEAQAREDRMRKENKDREDKMLALQQKQLSDLKQENKDREDKMLKESKQQGEALKQQIEAMRKDNQDRVELMKQHHEKEQENRKLENERREREMKEQRQLEEKRLELEKEKNKAEMQKLKEKQAAKEAKRQKEREQRESELKLLTKQMEKMEKEAKEREAKMDKQHRERAEKERKEAGDRLNKLMQKLEEQKEKSEKREKEMKRQEEEKQRLENERHKLEMQVQQASQEQEKQRLENERHKLEMQIQQQAANQKAERQAYQEQLNQLYAQQQELQAQIRQANEGGCIVS